jgi:mannose-6-phosphate isomerase-like protein (cupin superfamily)
MKRIKYVAALAMVIAGHGNAGLEMVPESATCKALVIGNAKYQVPAAPEGMPMKGTLGEAIRSSFAVPFGVSIAPLPGAEADANLIAEALTMRGFDVTKRHDLSASQINEAVAELAKSGADVIWVFYSGHGTVNNDGHSYLVGADARLSNNLNALLQQFSTGKPESVRIVTLDTDANRGTTQVPVGMLIQWAAQPGESATTDGKGYGIYSKALARELLSDDNNIYTLLRNVSSATFSSSSQKQMPMTVDLVQIKNWGSMSACGVPLSVRKGISK